MQEESSMDTKQQDRPSVLQLVWAKTKEEKMEIAMKLWGVTRERAEEIADKLLSV